MTRARWIALGLVLASVPLVFAQGGWIYTQGVRFDVSAQTCASNGGGTASSVTVTVLKTYVALTQSDPDGCALTLSETGARDGASLTVANVSANSATLADSAGVQETNAGVTITLAQYDTATFLYRSDRWVEVSRSQPQVGTTNTATLTNKTLTSPILSSGVQIASTTVTLTDAQIKALPTTAITLVSAPGSGKQIVPVTVRLKSNFAAGAYTNINATYASLEIAYGLHGAWASSPISNDSSFGIPLTRLSTFLGATTLNAVLIPYQEQVQSGGGAGDYGYPQPQVVLGPGQAENIALVIDIDNNGSGVLTGGNAANALAVAVVYLVIG